MEIYIGGGGDDLGFLNLGVVASYARARSTNATVLYLPNARLGALQRALVRSAASGEPVDMIGHSWGGPDAWRAAVWAADRSLPLRALITLDPVGGPLCRRFDGKVACPWLNVVAAPVAPDRSDRLTRLRGLSRKPSGLPTAEASREVVLDVNHWNVAAMMRLSDAWTWVGNQG